MTSCLNESMPTIIEDSDASITELPSAAALSPRTGIQLEADIITAVKDAGIEMNNSDIPTNLPSSPLSSSQSLGLGQIFTTANGSLSMSPTGSIILGSTSPIIAPITNSPSIDPTDNPSSPSPTSSLRSISSQTEGGGGGVSGFKRSRWRFQSAVFRSATDKIVSILSKHVHFRNISSMTLNDSTAASSSVTDNRNESKGAEEGKSLNEPSTSPISSSNNPSSSNANSPSATPLEKPSPLSSIVNPTPFVNEALAFETECKYFDAVTQWSRAAELGDPYSQWKIANYLYWGFGIKKDEKKAREYWLKSALSGHEGSKARCFEIGKGVFKKDEERAFDLMKKVAESGDSDAQLTLAGYYAEGIGTAKSSKKKVKALIKAAQYNPVAQNELAAVYAKGTDNQEINLKKAKELYEKAANYGFATAQLNLGHCYKQGRGVDVNFEEAAKWFERGAVQGEPNALNSMGVCYEFGDGVPLNLKKAFSYYWRSADQNNEFGLLNVGYFFKTGKAVKKDCKRAIPYFLMSASKGNSIAQATVGEVYHFGYGVVVDRRKAAVWFEKSLTTVPSLIDHSKNNPYARYLLGVVYEAGYGIKFDLPKSKEEAIKLYQSAAEDDDVDAINALQQFGIQSKGSRRKTINHVIHEEIPPPPPSE